MIIKEDVVICDECGSKLEAQPCMKCGKDVCANHRFGVQLRLVSEWHATLTYSRQSRSFCMECASAEYQKAAETFTFGIKRHGADEKKCQS